jgi:hypothetical protein
MSLAEFGFVSLTPGYSSARHDWKDSNINRKSEAQRQREEKEQTEKLAREEAAEKEAEDQQRKEEAEAKAAEEERLRLEAEDERINRPWWQKYADKYQGSGNNFHIGETTPPPEDDVFPSVYSVTNGWCPEGIHEYKSETKPAVIKPEVTKPEVTKPAVTKPEVTKPDVTKPDVTKPEVTKPEVTKPAVTKPEVTKPEVTEPETKPDIMKPETLLKEEVKVGTAKVVNTEKAVPMVLEEVEPEIECVKETTPEKQPNGKRTLSGLTEKMLAKSRVKKLKSKKAVIKKAAQVASKDIEEKENSGGKKSTTPSDTTKDEQPPPPVSNTEEGVRPIANRKRPLEDKDVEGQQDCRKFFCYCLMAFFTCLLSLLFSFMLVTLILVQIYS